jgi:hypothetical protein
LGNVGSPKLRVDVVVLMIVAVLLGVPSSLGMGSHGRDDRGSLDRPLCATGVMLRNSTLGGVVYADGIG